MKEVIGFALTLVVLGVAVLIGGAMVAKTENITVSIAPHSSLNISALAIDVGSAFSTLTSLLPLLVLAVVGGLSLFYLMSFMGRAV